MPVVIGSHDSKRRLRKEDSAENVAINAEGTFPGRSQVYCKKCASYYGLYDEFDIDP